VGSTADGTVVTEAQMQADFEHLRLYVKYQEAARRPWLGVEREAKTGQQWKN
jgi:hypothetical protein